jgi:regulator of CtrA degradation
MTGFSGVEERQTCGLLSFRDKFIASRQFSELYREGMDLVEETAEYLDRAGRLESKRLPAQVSIVYTSESIKLTTRLTQLASWLLVRRAIAAGEITATEAHTHRHRVTLVAQSGILPECFDMLPTAFKRLITESHRLYGRVLRLDPLLTEGYSAITETSPVPAQIERIKLEFPAA